MSAISSEPGADIRASCYHGGAFFSAIGDDFRSLERQASVISADVLDAWFDPAPAVIDALQRHCAWSLRTSPPTHGEGLQRLIAEARGVPVECVLPGAGSSALIYLALREWLDPASRVLILDPMYGEYAHVLEAVIGCRVTRFALERDASYRVDLEAFARAVEDGYDLVVIVNPNSPTGQHVRGEHLRAVLDAVPARTRIWIDETYVEYVGASESLERWAADSVNAVICKSMSKVYALSGVRCAYLCGAAESIDQLRPISPPWAVSLPAQIAACEALRDTGYYTARWRATHRLRESLARSLASLDWEVTPGCANFLLCRLPEGGATSAELIQACRKRDLFLRDVAKMSPRFDERMLRIAVKDARTNARMLAIISDLVASLR
jgi:histidinol-phosphate/aromatic aminotransferase/cobyric acid decarboxylase-like protein